MKIRWAGSADVKRVVVAVARPVLFGLIIFAIGSASLFFLPLVVCGALVGAAAHALAGRRSTPSESALVLRSQSGATPFHDGPNMSRISPSGGPGLVFMLGVVYMFLATFLPALGGFLFAALVAILAAAGALNTYRSLRRAS